MSYFCLTLTYIPGITSPCIYVLSIIACVLTTVITNATFPILKYNNFSKRNCQMCHCLFLLLQVLFLYRTGSGISELLYFKLYYWKGLAFLLLLPLVDILVDIFPFWYISYKILIMRNRFSRVDIDIISRPSL